MILEKADILIEWIEKHTSFFISWTIIAMMLIAVSVASAKAI